MQDNDKYEKTFTAPDANVLIVDDNELSLKTAETLFNFFQISVKKTRSGHEAFDLVRNESFDIIFLDQMMPDIDGTETAANIREWEKKFSNRKPLVIIALTAAAVYWEMFYSNGFDGCISKPLDTNTLAGILTRWLPKEKIKPVQSLQFIKSDICADKDLRNELMKMFLEDECNTYDDIENALKSDDIKKAHRLSHSLKSSAGHLHLENLKQAAADAEKSLSAGKNQITERQLLVLKEELMSALKKLTEELKTPER